MRAVFADTFYFLALLNPRDQYRDRAVQASIQGDTMVVTTRAVLLEVGDALAAPNARTIAGDFLQSLEDAPSVEIVPLDDTLHRQALALYRARPDKAWSLTDCASFVAMRERGLVDALTGDKHFEQAGFRALLR